MTPTPSTPDEEYAKRSEVGAIIAPPTFVQASAQFDPDYSLRPKPGQPWFGSGQERHGSAAEDRGGGGGGGGGGGSRHAEQHYEYHRPLKVGDVLTAETKPGKSWRSRVVVAAASSPAESVTEYRDQNGDLVVTATGAGVCHRAPGNGGLRWH